MSGIVELKQLLQAISPKLQPGEFVFCTVQPDFSELASLQPVGTFLEDEGLTLIIAAEQAEASGLRFDGKFRQISLQVHSSLEAVGLTAAVSAKLTAAGISANVVAAFYHDHVFVPVAQADRALSALQELGNG